MKTKTKWYASVLGTCNIMFNRRSKYQKGWVRLYVCFLEVVFQPLPSGYDYQIISKTLFEYSI